MIALQDNAMSDDPLPDNLRLAKLLAEKAVETIESAVETSYVHTPNIDVDAGIYDVDCSAFLGFLIGAVAERHYEMIAASTTHRRPLARDFYNFFAALPPTVDQVGVGSNASTTSYPAT